MIDEKPLKRRDVLLRKDDELSPPSVVLSDELCDSLGEDGHVEVSNEPDLSFGVLSDVPYRGRQSCDKEERVLERQLLNGGDQLVEGGRFEPKLCFVQRTSELVAGVR
ncbi:MAG: hypothetical protein ABSB24_18695 [Gaiellaceae bacterium]